MFRTLFFSERKKRLGTRDSGLGTRDSGQKINDIYINV